VLKCSSFQVDHIRFSDQLADSFSPLNYVRCLDYKSFEDVEDVFIAHARQHGVPTEYPDAISFLDKLGAACPDIVSRLAGPRERLVGMQAMQGASAK
jgi:hypothetical protein